ncbi:MAG: DUF4912 domain-containing protein [Spirochaetales bacterium]|nr:DUF4912 domain-containing protein [Spirochaetales bacterium]
MVLLKIDTLSTAELQYIASQENMDDWESLSREELIEGISELYDDVSEGSKDFMTKTGIHKFMNCLTDVQMNRMLNLPGVEALPDEYLETSIHLLMKDPFWGYVFWSISPNTKNECIDRDPDYRIFIRSHAVDEKGDEEEVYDIDVASKDRSWSIALPWMGMKYHLELVCEFPSEKIFEVLATSEVIQAPRAIGQDVIARLQNSNQASLILSCISSKNGEIINNRLVNELFNQLNPKIVPATNMVEETK